MKKIGLFVLLFSCFLLTACKEKESITTIEDNPHVLQDKLGFVYQEISINGSDLVIDGFITNGFEETIHPYSLYIKVYQEDYILAEDTLLFSEGYYIVGDTINKVAITLALNETVTTIEAYEVYYEYKINENPINQTV